MATRWYSPRVTQTGWSALRDNERLHQFDGAKTGKPLCVIKKEGWNRRTPLRRATLLALIAQ